MPVAFVLNEDVFHRMIALERKRTERSEKPFLLVLLDAGTDSTSPANRKVLERALLAISLSTRATDVIGWYTRDQTVGVMFTEINIDHHGTILSTMMTRICETLQKTLSMEKFSQIGISLHVFPEAWNHESTTGNPILYPDVVTRERKQKLYRVTKRWMDVGGSIVALILLAPLFLVVAALVKLTSEGPVIFKQKRLSQFGETFTFLKFRSMHVNNDSKLHAEFMKHVIRGSYEGTTDGTSKPVYKMTNDPRVTRIGRFLRRASLDELPQFINVLRGDMSLVGPRPPIAYECEEYDVWHRRRVLEVKPGITGLWQVKGRSRIRFDDMVRLDLQYVRQRSLWLDLQILMQTPRAVLFGGDAF